MDPVESVKGRVHQGLEEEERFRQRSRNPKRKNVTLGRGELTSYAGRKKREYPDKSKRKIYRRALYSTRE